MNKKALVQLSLGVEPVQLGLTLEVMQRRQDEGYDIAAIVCDARLPSCDQNVRHSFVGCIRCVGTRTNGLRALRRPVRTIEIVHDAAAHRAQLRSLPRTFDTVAELTAVRVGTFDVGWAALSTLVSALREPQPDLALHRETLACLVVGASAVYLHVGRLLDEEGFDRVIVFNGRIADQRAALRAAQERSIPCDVVEVGGAKDRVTVFPSVMPHDVDHATRAMNAAWQQAPDAKRRAAADSFFVRSATAVPLVWDSFVSAQQRDKLPRGFDPAANNVALFVSSEDEFVAISDSWNYGAYPSQIDGIRHVIDVCARDPSMHLYVRVHPGLRGMDNSQTRALRTLRDTSGLTIIEADSDVSTYALLRSARRVVTFGSTVGIEATYWGISSILIGQALFRGLDATHNAATAGDVEALCLARDLAPKQREGALIFGHYYATLGEPCRHFAARSPLDVTFRGQPLSPSPSHQLVMRALSTSAGAPARLVARRTTAAGALLTLTGRPTT